MYFSKVWPEVCYKFSLCVLKISFFFFSFFLTFFVFLANIPVESYRLPKSSLTCSVSENVLCQKSKCLGQEC